jgi:hypothetical protein
MSLLFGPDDPSDHPPKRWVRNTTHNLLFQETKEEKRRLWLQRHGIEPATTAVLGDFQTLQAIRRKGTPRWGTPESHHERQTWTHLIKHLTQLPPPRG